MDAIEIRAATPDDGDWFRPGSDFETQVAVVDGVPIGHVSGGAT